MTTLTLWAAALLLLPLIVLFHLTKSKPQRIREMRSRVWTWQRCADRFDISPSTARRWAAALL